MSSPVQDAGSAQSMSELLDSMEPLKTLRRGDVVEGLVMRADSDGIFVNIGHKAEGVVPPAEMRTLDPSALQELKVGDEIVTLVVRAETAEHAAILSIDRAIGEEGWRVLEKAMEVEKTLEGTIAGFNRGGAIVEVEGVQGFVPMSQLVSVSRAHFREIQEPRIATETEKQDGEGEPADGPKRDPLAEDVGKVLQLKVLEVNRGRNRAIFSERQAVQEWRDEQKAKLIQELSEGEVRRGVVTGISTFGAFVDLGGADGLIHISELSWNPVNSPEEVVMVGEELDVFVLRVDAENNKIALSLRRLQPEPWETINDRYQAGDIVDATITKLTNFGAFARVKGDGGSVEGLIHISELTSRMVSHPKEVVKEGDEVKVKILRIEAERRRLGLSLKQAAEEEYGYEAEEEVEIKAEAEPEKAEEEKAEEAEEVEEEKAGEAEEAEEEVEIKAEAEPEKAEEEEAEEEKAEEAEEEEEEVEIKAEAEPEKAEEEKAEEQS